MRVLAGQGQQGQPPLRPVEDCDLPDRPCRWFIYKDVTKPRRVHYERPGFTPPPAIQIVNA